MRSHPDSHRVDATLLHLAIGDGNSIEKRSEDITDQRHLDGVQQFVRGMKRNVESIPFQIVNCVSKCFGSDNR